MICILNVEIVVSNYATCVYIYAAWFNHVASIWMLTVLVVNKHFCPLLPTQGAPFPAWFAWSIASDCYICDWRGIRSSINQSSLPFVTSLSESGNSSWDTSQSLSTASICLPIVVSTLPENVKPLLQDMQYTVCMWSGSRLLQVNAYVWMTKWKSKRLYFPLHHGEIH